MSCVEKDALLTDYQRTLRQYSDTVGELKQRIGITSKTEYERMCKVAEETRLSAERLRVTLEEHTSEHGC